MKTSFYKQIISMLLVIVMVFSIIPISSINIVAAENTSNTSTASKQMTPLQKYRANTTNSLEKITSYIAKREAESAKPINRFNNKISKINKVAGSIGKVANAALTIYNAVDPDNTWYENVGNIALSLVTSYLGITLPGQESEAEMILSEVKNMINDLEERLGKEFEAVNANIDELSKKVDANSVNLAAYVSQYIDRAEYKDALNKFTENFNYYNYKKELATAYEDLITTINSGANEANIKISYDNLYSVAKKSEVSKDGSAGLYDYIVGSNRMLTDGYSIQEILYNYSVMAENSQRDNLEIECIEFAEDLYDTYVFAQYALTLCYNYQLGYLYTYADNPMGEHYTFYSDVNESAIGFSSILAKTTESVVNLEKVNEEFAQYICYVLNFESSFIYESGALTDHNLYQVPYKEVFAIDAFESQPFNTSIETISYSDVGDRNYYVRTNNRVSPGDTLYLNVMPELFESFFATGDFYFKIDDNGSKRAIVNKAGVVNILNDAQNGSFTVTMYYNDDENPMYSMTFEVVDRAYAGGFGTEKAPYLISEWDHIVSLANCSDHYTAIDIYFVLTNDVSAEGATFTGIPSFKGLFDGDGYTIHSFLIEDTTQVSEKSVGFFKTNAGRIVNLLLGKEELSGINDHSISIVSKANEIGNRVKNYHHIGALVGQNSGYIYNCFLNNVYVNGELYDKNNNADAFCNAGGIAGYNNGKIEQCSISNSTIKSYLTADASDGGSGDDNYVTTGGIAGKNEGEISSSISHTNKLLSADARGNGTSDNTAYPEAAVGGLVGDSRNGNVLSSVVYDNNIEVYASEGGNTVPAIFEGLYIGSTKETFKKFEQKTVYYHGDPCKNYYENCTGSAYGVVLNPDKKVAISEALILDLLTIVYYSYSDLQKYDTGECYSINDVSQFKDVLTEDCWEFNSDFPTLKFVTKSSASYEKVADKIIIENITEYYQGETNFKYISYSSSVAPEYGNETIFSYPLSSHRIDTSDVGETNVVILSQIKDSHVYTKEEIQINVIEREVAEIYIYSMPVKKDYLIGDTIDISGLNIFAKYNNGFCAPLSLDEISIDYDFSNQGNTNVMIAYDDTHSVDYVVNVTCGHKNVVMVEKQEPSFGNIGYTEGIYCNDCETYISGHEEIPALEYLPGDINGDGVVNTKDTTRLMRYLAGWDVEVNEAALDVNGDGVVNTKDTTRLMRYLAGWGVEIH